MRLPSIKEIRPIEFIALVASIMLLTALAIDIMLPAFADLRQYFHLGQDSTPTAQVVTFFFLGQIGQLIFGPLSDRYGRLLILKVGFVLYIGGCVAAALLPNLGWILAARFVVGMGAASMSVSAVASVRDRYVGDKMARTMSLILTIFLFVPIVAPILGSVILSVTSWQVVFLTPAIIAVAVFVWSFRLNESLPPERRTNLNLPTLIRSARSIGGNRVFVRYTAITTILFCVFSSYIGSSERMISEIYERPELFVWIFAGVGITMAIFTFLNAQLVGRFGARRTVRGLLITYLILACLLLGLTLVLHGTPNVYIFFAFVALLQGINIAVEPNNSALALEPLGSTAGMAAAIYGTSFFVVGAIMGSFIDRLLVDTVTPLAVGYLTAGLLAVVLVYSGHSGSRPAAVANVVGSEIAD
jgi:DHA1 family bicyclomycin/chloramphenicol resistance-like MFS transporter